ncbi:hypothetical protein GCM10011391_06440 [Pullulanibacillus camelliae]|uniref:HTH cro/C1-type domain-containing protein n=1 Tax=Pullulanibacillus camelliae TaxID=1707096 RepID=A0A8J2VKP5_9BACL|nr:helix-turn-helix domain-containing protein [Pullulanibacillus camelliae]GGE30513.1 hypothetical protein GCM10011391_06440 [Pullulanibacillus camelliae]
MIGSHIQNIRKKKGYTLSEVADQASISKSYLSNIERNVNQNPSIQVMKRIAAALDVDLKTLINGVGQSPPHLDQEWLDFVQQLKDSGIDKEQIKNYKTVIDFIQWQHENQNNTEGSSQSETQNRWLHHGKKS